MCFLFTNVEKNYSDKNCTVQKDLFTDLISLTLDRVFHFKKSI